MSQEWSVGDHLANDLLRNLVKNTSAGTARGQLGEMLTLTLAVRGVAATWILHGVSESASG
jgi:hypothetical protein